MRKTILGLLQWEARVNELYSTAIICKMSHEAFLQKVDTFIYSELNRKTAGDRKVYSSYISGFVQGLMAVHRANLYRFELEFCYSVDGVLYSTSKTSSKRKTEEFYQSGKGYLLSNAPCAHYWKNSDKPFSTPSVFGAKE